MEKKFILSTIAGFSVFCQVASLQAANNMPATLASDQDKLSYSIGVDLGKSFKNQNIDINVPAMSKGIEDSLRGKDMLLTEPQIQEILTKFQKELMAKRHTEFMKKAEDNKTKGEAFLAANKEKAGVVVLPSGLQYKIVTQGKGVKPNKDDTVVVEYTGTLIDGQVFDSTDKAGKPASFKVSEVIPGWTEALQLMPAGSTWEVYIPSGLAYGPRSMGNIGPNETLVFKVHLLNVEKNKS